MYPGSANRDLDNACGIVRPEIRQLMGHRHDRPELNPRHKVALASVCLASYAFLVLIVRRFEFAGHSRAGRVGLPHQQENSQPPPFRNRRFASSHAVGLFEASRIPFLRILKRRIIIARLRRKQGDNQ